MSQSSSPTAPSPNDLFRNYIDHCDQLVFFTDVEGYIIYFNENTRKYFRFENIELKNNHVSAIFEAFSKLNFFQIFKQGWSGNVPLKVFHGEHVYVKLNCCPIKNADGKTVEAFCFTMDDDEILSVPIFSGSDTQDVTKLRKFQSMQSNIAVPFKAIEAELENLAGAVKEGERSKVSKLVAIKDQLKASFEDMLFLQTDMMSFDILNSTTLKVHDLINEALDGKGNADFFSVSDRSKGVELSGDRTKLLYCFSRIIEYVSEVSHEDKSIAIVIDFDSKRDQIKVDFLYFPKSLYLENPNVENEHHLDYSLPYSKRIIELHKGNIKIFQQEHSFNLEVILPLSFDPYLNTPIRIIVIDEDDEVRDAIESLLRDKPKQVEIRSFADFESAEISLAELSNEILIFNPRLFKHGKGEDPVRAAFNLLDRFNKNKLVNMISVSELWNDESEKKKLLSMEGIKFLPKPLLKLDFEILLRSELNTVKRDRHLSRRVREVQKYAITDELTQLYNRRHFENSIHEILQKAENSGQSLCVIILDIDHFKHFNDTNGHQLGDEVLKLFARVLKSSVRMNDMVVRFGGEEFLIVLPNANKENGTNIAHKIRDNILNADFINGESQPLGQVTASMGLAVFPDDSIHIKELIEISDKCLYQSKKEGRNRISAT